MAASAAKAAIEEFTKMKDEVPKPLIDAHVRQVRIAMTISSFVSLMPHLVPRMAGTTSLKISRHIFTHLFSRMVHDWHDAKISILY